LFMEDTAYFGILNFDGLAKHGLQETEMGMNRLRHLYVEELLAGDINLEAANSEEPEEGNRSRKAKTARA